ncbi:MAG: bifunctional 4-hydroxy-2-oxoglutarate aldolase/2-dehydro-3-deoxy-phosphogluconate aldolase [Actinobacteria bacterium]|nr:bifunctional 4-hydroxy-2-oxoglutarate aldolase/2-dehydro-3-deoxy-phosphogluconate aldolase [Actinomycetota bacterium]
MTDLARVREVGALAVIRAPSADAALLAVDALLAGGVTGIEITYSTPDAAAAIAAARERHGDRALVGAGTLTTLAQVAEAAAAGAEFLVSPGLDDEVVTAMVGSGCLAMAGALTPTEVMRARRLGVDVVKVFPSSLVGPDYLKALRGPFPDLVAMPTGGVDAANAGAWLRAGAIAVGVGGELCRPADMVPERDGRITEAARRLIAAVDAARVPDAP